jgi:hypothetical protein
MGLKSPVFEFKRIRTMRQAGLQGTQQTSTRMSLRALRIAAVALGVGLVAVSGAYAGDDDDDEEYQPSIMDNIMSGLGARPSGDTGIQYRERSPLVVPSKTELPPPSGKKSLPANWPKDPDEIARKEAIAASKEKQGPVQTPIEMQRALLPSELNVKPKGSSRRAADSATPGVNSSGNPVMLSPSELGYKGGLFSNVFGGNKSEEAKFKSEPPRESLSQPPVGYQTPSPNYAYGTGPSDWRAKEYNPAAGKYGDK